MHHVLPLTSPLRYKHADNIFLPIGYSLFDLLLAHIEAESIILRCLMLLTALLYPKLLQPISCAKTMISLACLNIIVFMIISHYIDKFLNVFLIECKSVRLNIRSVRSLLILVVGIGGPFIPVKATPGEHVLDSIDRTGNFS